MADYSKREERDADMARFLEARRRHPKSGRALDTCCVCGVMATVGVYRHTEPVLFFCAAHAPKEP